MQQCIVLLLLVLQVLLVLLLLQQEVQSLLWIKVDVPRHLLLLLSKQVLHSQGQVALGVKLLVVLRLEEALKQFVIVLLEELLLELMVQELLQLLLPHWVLVYHLLLFLQNHDERLVASQVDHVVLVAALVARGLLIRSVSPISIHSELVLILLWVQHL